MSSCVYWEQGCEHQVGVHLRNAPLLPEISGPFRSELHSCRFGLHSEPISVQTEILLALMKRVAVASSTWTIRLAAVTVTVWIMEQEGHGFKYCQPRLKLPA